MIDKELFEKNFIELRSKEVTDDIYEKLLISTFSNTTGKIGKLLEVTPLDQAFIDHQIEPTEKDASSFQDIFNDLEKTVPHIKFGKYLERQPKEEGNYYFHGYNRLTFKKNCDLNETYRYWLGEDILFVISSGETFAGSGVYYDYISKIIYNDNSISLAKEIWSKYSISYFDLFKGRVKKETKHYYGVYTITIDAYGKFQDKFLNIESKNDLSEGFYDNYNSDLPLDKIENFLKSDEGGILILNGPSGTGKSTFLKRLIMENQKIRFTICPDYIVAKQRSFRDYIISEVGKNKIFIIEDCEALLVTREKNGVHMASIISDILNYTDGILGDFVKTKFIFTFNTDHNKIDKAILRKGRLKLRYEFNPLKGENLEKIAKKTGYPLTDKEKESGVTLADLYTGKEQVDMKTKETKKIGF